MKVDLDLDYDEFEGQGHRSSLFGHHCLLFQSAIRKSQGHEGQGQRSRSQGQKCSPNFRPIIRKGDPRSISQESMSKVKVVEFKVTR